MSRSVLSRCTGAPSLGTLTRNTRPRIVPGQLRPSSRVQARGFATDFARLPEYLQHFWRTNRRRSPVLFPVAVFSVSGAVIFGGFWLRALINEDDKFNVYPPNVKRKLRRALWFTDQKPDSGQAFQGYLQALGFARQEEMDKLSDEVLGIYIDFARSLEKFGHPTESIQMLEEQRRECMRWVMEEGQKEGNEENRARLLRKSVQLAHKIAELFTIPHIQNRQKSEEFLTWAVETTLKESQENVKRGLAPILEPEEQGAQLESLAHHYEEKNNFLYASQLFLRALTVRPEHDCHSVILMNNLAAALAQQKPVADMGSQPPSMQELRDSARTWLKQAIDLSGQIKPPIRTPECDNGCAVAIHNLGEFAEMDGNIKEARDKYEEAGSIAHAIGFQEGVISAQEGLKRLSSPSSIGKKKGATWWK